MENNHETTEVTEIPDCDLCKANGQTVPAMYDAKLDIGPWAFVCEAHFDDHRCHVGLGLGQELILKEDK